MVVLLLRLGDLTADDSVLLVAWDPGLDCSGYAAYSRRWLGTGVTIEERAGPALILAGSLSTQPPCR